MIFEGDNCLIILKKFGENNTLRCRNFTVKINQNL